MLKINSEKLIVSVKPYGENKNYSDSVFNLKIAPENKETCISLAEIALKEEIPLLTLSSYRECEKTGNRDNFEIKYFKKRKMLLELTAGEIADGFKGRFLEKAMDLMWSICEETTWVIPAHRQKESYPNCNWVDIMSASTGGVMAAAYFFLESALYTSENGEKPENLAEIFRFEADNGEHNNEVRIALYKDFKCEFFTRNVRPVPDGGGFFENVWKDFRENGNVY